MADLPPPHAPMSYLDLRTRRIELFLFLIFFHVDHFFALVMPAARADCVGQSHFSAVRALNKILCFQCILRTAAVAAASGKLTLWLWGHSLLPVPV
jgi:hypothetical protein